MQKKTAKFASHTNDSAWETLEQRRIIVDICVLCKVYTGEQTWENIRDRLQGPCYLSRHDHDHKIRVRIQRTDR